MASQAARQNIASSRSWQVRKPTGMVKAREPKASKNLKIYHFSFYQNPKTAQQLTWSSSWNEDSQDWGWRFCEWLKGSTNNDKKGQIQKPALMYLTWQSSYNELENTDLKYQYGNPVKLFSRSGQFTFVQNIIENTQSSLKKWQFEKWHFTHWDTAWAFWLWWLWHASVWENPQSQLRKEWWAT